MDEEEELSYLAVGLQAVSAFFFVLAVCEHQESA